MGAATLQAYRILFTATDLRPGVWLPHPALVRAARTELDAPNSFTMARNSMPTESWEPPRGHN
jgi:hypothetical protein